VTILAALARLYNDVKGIYGYRRMTMNINRILNKQYNLKRIYRLMKSANLRSVIRKKKKAYLPSTPQITAENVLNRNFKADKPNQKWLTDGYSV
jgi:transposase InsO family protein